MENKPCRRVAAQRDSPQFFATAIEDLDPSRAAGHADDLVLPQAGVTIDCQGSVTASADGGSIFIQQEQLIPRENAAEIALFVADGDRLRAVPAATGCHPRLSARAVQGAQSKASVSKD